MHSAAVRANAVGALLVAAAACVAFLATVCRPGGLSDLVSHILPANAILESESSPPAFLLSSLSRKVSAAAIAVGGLPRIPSPLPYGDPANSHENHKTNDQNDKNEKGSRSTQNKLLKVRKAGVSFREVSRMRGGNGVDQALVQFDIHADFTPVLDQFATKQLFIYVVCVWQSDSAGAGGNGTLHTVTIWDKIITKASEAVLDLRDLQNKYALIDPDGRLRGQSATLRLRWDTTPAVGWLRRQEAPGMSKFSFPARYTA